MTDSLRERLGLWDLTGRKVAITGASRGLGKSMALGFAAAGAHVELLARSTDDLEAVKKRCEELGGTADALHFDVSSEDSIRKGFAEIASRHPKLDAWVSNAGIGPKAIRKNYETPPIALGEIPFEMWRKTVDTNLNGTFLCMQLVVPLLEANGGGAIINISTSPVTMERRGFIPYGATKAAIRAMTLGFADELRELNIRANTHAPGGITWSDMVPEGFDEEGKYVLQPTVMIPAAVFLVSNEGAGTAGECIMGRTWNEEHGFAEANDGLGEWKVFLEG